MTLVGSEKRQIRKCFMLISMEISLIYQRRLASPARRARSRGSRRPDAAGSCEDVSISSGRARLPLLSLFFFPLSAAFRGSLSHDGFIGPHFPPDPFQFSLLPGVSKEICGSPSRDAAYKVISSLATTSIVCLIVLARCRRWQGLFNNSISS